MSAWRPAETAPKDGTRILVWTAHGDIELSDWYSISREDFEEVAGGFYRKTMAVACEGWNSNTFTHWMPLPEPPL